VATKNRQSIDSRRGLDPKWRKVVMDYTIFAVHAPCAEVAPAYIKVAGDCDGTPVDCLRRQVRIIGDDWQRAVFIYQLRTCDWTHVQSLGNRVGWSSGMELSRCLKAKVLAYCYGDTAGVFGHYLYDMGKCIEEFSTGRTPEFDDSNRAQRLAEGWQLSDDNGRQLRSSRLGSLDMNSPAVFTLSDQIARDFDLFVPCCPWTVNPKTELVQLEKPWSRETLASAAVVLSHW
jgi:hypothetical protein